MLFPLDQEQDKGKKKRSSRSIKNKTVNQDDSLVLHVSNPRSYSKHTQTYKNECIQQGLKTQDQYTEISFTPIRVLTIANKYESIPQSIKRNKVFSHNFHQKIQFLFAEN